MRSSMAFHGYLLGVVITTPCRPKGDAGGTTATSPQLAPFAPHPAPQLESFAGSPPGLQEGGGWMIFLQSLLLSVPKPS